MFMAAIYSQAQQVLCWLGEDDGDHAKHTFDAAERFCMKVKPPPDDGECIEIKCQSGETFHAQHYLISALNAVDDEIEQELKGGKTKHVKGLFQKAWFYRMWIRQEIGYASKALVLCGDSEIDWNDLEWFRSWTVFKCRISTSGSRMRLGNFREVKYLIGNTARAFFDLLLESTKFQCTEPRDRIFALLSHPSAYKEYRHSMMRNYSADVVEAISDRNDKAIIGAKLKIAQSDLLADIGRFTTSLADQFEDGDPWREFYINLTKSFEASSGIFGHDGRESDSSNSLVVKLDETQKHLQSAYVSFQKMFVTRSAVHQLSSDSVQVKWTTAHQKGYHIQRAVNVFRNSIFRKIER